MTTDVKLLSLEEMREKSKEELDSYFIKLLHRAEEIEAIPFLYLDDLK